MDHSPSRRPGRAKDLTQGPITRTLLLFSLPVLGANVLQSLSGSINAVWVGRFLGERALTATANANLVLFFLLGAVFGVGMAATILVGQAMGARDLDRAKRVVGTTATFFAIISVALAAAGYLLTPTILGWMQTPADAQPLAEDYLRVIFIALPFMYFLTMLMMVMRGSGDARTPFVFMALSAVLDMGLNPLLILGLGPMPRLGIAGAATATLVAQVISLVAMLAWIYGRRYELRLAGRELGYLRPDRAIMAATVRKGLPMGLQMIVVSSSAIMMISTVNRFGSQVSAAYGVAVQLWTYVQMPAMAIGAAASSMAAQNVGAGAWDRVRRTAGAGVRINIMLTGGLVLLLYLFDRAALKLFLPGDSAAVAIAAHLNAIVLWSFVPFGVMFVLFGVVRATGAVVPPLAILFVTLILVRVPAARGFVGTYGMDAIWWALALTPVLSMVLAILYYRFGGWRKARMTAVPELDSGEAADTGVAVPAMDGMARPARPDLSAA